MNLRLYLVFPILLMLVIFAGCNDARRSTTSKEYNGLPGPPKTDNDIGSVMFENRNEMKAGTVFDVTNNLSGNIDYLISETGKYVVVRMATSSDGKYIVVECKSRLTNRYTGDGHE